MRFGCDTFLQRASPAPPPWRSCPNHFSYFKSRPGIYANLVNLPTVLHFISSALARAVLRILFCGLLGASLTSSLPASGKDVGESARSIPVAYEVDVVVVGGSSAGVAAAVEAAKSGAKVFPRGATFISW